MTNEEINAKVNSAFKSVSPDNFQKILSNAKKNKGSVIDMTEPRPPIFRRIAAIAAVFVLVAAVIGVWVVNPFDDGVAVVSIDVNPSVYIQLDKDEKVIDVVPFNEDGKKIIGTMNFEGADLSVAVNALIGSMLRNGYLTEIENSLLVTVEGKNHAENESLRKKVESEIAAALKGGNFTPSILNLELDDNDMLEDFAEKNKISEGKAKLVMQLAAQFPQHTAEELAKLSINELNLLALNTDNIKAKGEPSKKSYIGDEKAWEIAYKQIGVTVDQVTAQRMELEFDDGIMIYEVEVFVENFEYDVEINALTGDVVGFDGEETESAITVEPSKNTQPENPSETTEKNTENSNVIVEADAKSIALKRAGVVEKNISNFVCKVDIDDGIKVYDIEFISGKYEYSVDVNAQSGKIIEYSREYIDDDDDDDNDKKKPTVSTTAAAKNYIGTAKAKTIALNKAGVAASNIKNYKCQLERDDGVAVYDVEFHSGKYEYSLGINAVTGAVIDYEKDIIDD